MVDDIPTKLMLLGFLGGTVVSIVLLVRLVFVSNSSRSKKIMEYLQDKTAGPKKW